MIKFGKWVVKHKVIILIIGFVLMIPCFFGYMNTRVNFDILSYLPKDIETMEGQDILIDEFGKGGFSLVMVEGMKDKDVAAVAEDIEDIDGVADVVCYQSMTDLTIPKEILPSKVYDFFNSDDTTMMAVFFEESTSDDKTMDAITEMRKITNEQVFISGMSAVTTDMKNLTKSEVPVYALLAVIFTTIVLLLTTDSFLVPLFFMLSIGAALVWNLGTNIFMGEISFVTQALCMVLQLGVTMDYSIFLWHSYEEQLIRFEGDKERAMAHAISGTIVSVTSSSFTTVAGFLSMCFMSFTLGLDLGIVMAKGVVFGVIACVTVLPSMILLFDKPIQKTRHKELIPDLKKITDKIVKGSVFAIIAAIVVFVPAFFGYTHYNVYYNLDSTLPKDLESVVANSKLSEEYGMNSTHMLLVNADMSGKDANRMIEEMEDVDGVKYVLGFNSLVGDAIPEEIIPDSIKDILKSDKWQLMLVGSDYKIASDEVGEQLDELNAIMKTYDKNGMLIGEAPATNDLIKITDRDFKVVSIVSIAVIFLIIAITFKSVSLPVILVSVIELAIIINLGLAYYLGESLPFIASVVVGTIQLGSTVDYAILMTTRYKRERSRGKEKKEAVSIALSTSVKSVIVSAFGFFAATIGIGFYSDIGMISSLCSLLARGALISLVVVITVLPAMFMVFDKVIIKTSAGFKPKKA